MGVGEKMQKKILKKIVIFVVLLLLFIQNNSYAMVIVLDPGHGGADSGAVNTAENIKEKDVNLTIAQYIKKYLEDYDAEVKLTHNGLTNQELPIFDRAMIARNANADLFVSLHINSSETTSAKGAEVYVTANRSLDKYYKNTSELANLILENLNKLGITKRGVFTRQLSGSDKTDVYSDGTIADYYGVIRYGMRGTRIDYGVVRPEGATSAIVENGEGVPTILVEHCFIIGTDVQFVKTEEAIAKLAKADADAIIAYYHLAKKTIPVESVTLNKQKVGLVIRKYGTTKSKCCASKCY